MVRRGSDTRDGPRATMWLLLLALASLLFLPLLPWGPVDTGTLEVRSSPEIATQIRVGEYHRNTSRIVGLSLPTGPRLVCFSAPPGDLPPACERVTVESDTTVRVTGHFVPSGWLELRTEPQGLGATILVEGVARDIDRITIPVAAGRHEVCFDEIEGYGTPPCRYAELMAGQRPFLVAEYGVREPAASGER